jgi:predicted transposase/invertase (TIGR01784 family)
MEREIISFDYAIKNILRDKANFDILSGFLTELLNKPVNVQEVLESEGNTSAPDDKINRLDLKAKIDNDEIAVFEIQYFDQIDFLGKVLFNACKAVVEQISSGELFDVKKVYSVNIAYFGMGAKDEYLFVANLTDFIGVHYEETIPFAQNINTEVPQYIHPHYFLILPNVFKKDKEDKKEKWTPFDEWIYVLKNASVKSEFTAAGIQAASEKLNVLKMTPQQKADYERQHRMNISQKSQLYTAELKGRSEGEAIGLEKEKEQAVVRGYKKGYSTDVIAEFTDFSPDQILKILKRNGLE